MLIKFQNYKHYKLPITINPLEYGKLIFKTDNIFIIQITPKTLTVIKEFDKINEIKFFRDGDLIFTYKDLKIDENTFVRSLENKRFTFKNNELVETQKTIILFMIVIYIIFYVIFPDLANSFYETNIATSFSSYNIIKLRKSKSLHNWKFIEFNIENKLFSKDLFKSKFNLFWNKVIAEFTENNHMFTLLKIKYKGSDFTTIGKLQRLNKNDKDWYFNWIINNIIYKSEYYNETPIESLIFSYGFKNEKLIEKETIQTNVHFQNYKNNKLPISFNPLDYGRLISEIKWENYTQFILQSKENFLFNINKFDNYNEISLIYGGNIILNFKDELISNEKFVRIIDNKKYYYDNHKEILFLKKLKTNFISKISLNKNLTKKFITLDIETFIKNNILTVCCISIFNGQSKSYYFLSDFKNVEELIITALKSILIRKYNGFSVYIHNMHKFDGIFLLKYLPKLGNTSPIIHNERLISINLNYGKNNEYKIQFKDSYLILLDSLSNLGKGFGVEVRKSIFPFLFVNENNLNYFGEVPEFKYFGNKIDKIDYNNYVSKFNNNWNLREELIKYCGVDSESLYQIILKFSQMIFDLFQRNVHHYPTLPSLAFAIFRANFMNEENIPQLSGKIAKDIRMSYTGGAVDMYIPKPPKGIKIKCLDVNALYPSQMQKWPMPIGNPTLFKGDIRLIDSNAFGFFYCEIIAPDNIKHPIIQTHVKTNSGIRTMAPIGTWEDMIFSEEMDNAIKYGYKFNILWGYTFEKGYIFNDYVKFLYKIRDEYPRSHPMFYIAKILLNSLYGRFGMDDNFIEVIVMHKDYFADFENKFFDNILDSQNLGDYKLVKFKKPENTIENDETTHNVSIAIASAITAYARIHMTQFKNNPKINLYYTDTDSIYTDSDVDDSLIDNRILGKLKLENTCKKAIFLSPKVYCLETIDGKTIYKVKGLKHEIELNMKDFEQLLYKDALIEKNQVKWRRSFTNAHIELLEQVYTLKVTDNKRKLIYNKNNKLIGTKPYVIDKNKDIT